MLIRKNIIEEDILSLNNEQRKIAHNDFFIPHLIFDLQVKLLEEQNLLNEARLGILLL